MALLLNILVDGVAYGMILFMIAVGLSVTMGLMQVVNLAHGGFALIGGTLAHWLGQDLGLGFWAALVLALAGPLSAQTQPPAEAQPAPQTPPAEAADPGEPSPPTAAATPPALPAPAGPDTTIWINDAGAPRPVVGVGYDEFEFTNVQFTGGAIYVDNLEIAEPAEVCLPDTNGDGLLNINDFIAFQTLFAISDPAADFNGDGLFTINDFVAFQTAFAALSGITPSAACASQAWASISNQMRNLVSGDQIATMSGRE